MLKLENITVLFDDLKAVDHVNMEFMEGKITGIIGTNGSGKSTLMKVMTKLLKPQEGSVSLDNQVIQDKKKALFAYRQEVNMVFQNPEQQLFYTIAKDDIGMALENLGYSKEECEKRVQEAIELMDIEELQYRPVQYLSYGQKKKVAIAGMLALKPRFLLLDEPTAGLDPKGRDQMAMIMKKLVSNGTSIIVTSHDMDLMYDCCDYAYLIKKGKIMTQGTKYEVFQEEKLLLDAGLSVPWIVKLHQAIQTPLVENEEILFEQLKEGYLWQNR